MIDLAVVIAKPPTPVLPATAKATRGTAEINKNPHFIMGLRGWPRVTLTGLFIALSKS